jgi:hypothetical protein
MHDTMFCMWFDGNIVNRWLLYLTVFLVAAIECHAQAVTSVNGQTGAVVLTAQNVGANTASNAVFDIADYVALYSSGCTFSYGTGSTPLDCAVLAAGNYITTNRIGATLRIHAGTYNFTKQIVLPVNYGNASLSIIGPSSGSTNLNYTGSAISSGGAIDEASGYYERLTLAGFRLSVNQLAPDGVYLGQLNQSELRDLTVADATYEDFYIAGNQVQGSHLLALQSGSYPQGYGAFFIPTITSGSVTALMKASYVQSNTVTSAGSGYTSATVAFSGGGCTVTPTGSVVLSGGSVSSITMNIRGLCTSAPTATIAGNGTGAAVTPALQTFGGSGYNPATTAIHWYGYGASGAPDQPCNSLPTATLSFAGSSPTSVSGATITSGGSGCTANTYAQVIDQPVTSYGIENAAYDSSFYDIESAVGTIAGIYNHADAVAIVHAHPYYVPVGILNTAGGLKLYGTECDSTRQYCISTNYYFEAFGTSEVWDGNGPYPGAVFLHYTGSAARVSNIDGLTASNTQNGGGYAGIVDSTLGRLDVSPYENFPSSATNFADATPSGTTPTYDIHGLQTIFGNSVTIAKDSATSPGLLIGTGFNGNYEAFSGDRAFFGFDPSSPGYAIIQGASGKGIEFSVNNNTFAQGVVGNISVAGVMTMPVYATKVYDLASSATPAINAANGMQTITLSANATPTVTGIAVGERFTIQICQPASGGPYTWTWPASIHGGMTIGTTAGTCSVQAFDSFSGTTLVAEALGVTNVAP